MPIADYDYRLPDERIAKYPLTERDASKLLVYRNEEISETVFSDLPRHLPEGCLLVCNNTRVIHARIVFRKPTGARIEVFCLEPAVPADYALSLSATRVCEWKCLVGNRKKWKSGRLEQTVTVGGATFRLSAEQITTTDEAVHIRFEWDDSRATFSDILEQTGELPIPPYLNRASDDTDKVAYQTVYSRVEGSVAAPTAGLHFTDRVFGALQQRSIALEELTLHVGAGTFRPVKSDDVAEHLMHTETIAVPLATIRRIRAHRGNVVAVGTTSVRTLESLYYIGKQCRDSGTKQMPLSALRVAQWEPYRSDEEEMSAGEALQHIIDYMERNGLKILHAETQILIKPGFRFRVVDAMITNFHQPKSTLLLLVSAFVGDDWRRIYDFALRHGFRFLSYGDSSLLFKKNLCLPRIQR